MSLHGGVESFFAEEFSFAAPPTTATTCDFLQVDETVEDLTQTRHFTDYLKPKEEIGEDAYAFGGVMELDTGMPSIGVSLHDGSSSPTLGALASPIKFEQQLPSFPQTAPVHVAVSAQVHPTPAMEVAVPIAAIPVAALAHTPALSNAHVPARSSSKNATPASRTVKATIVKREPLSPSAVSVVSTAAFSPSMAALVGGAITATPFTPPTPATTMRALHSVSSGGSGAASECSDSDSDVVDAPKRKSSAKSAKGRKRKSDDAADQPAVDLALGSGADDADDLLDLGVDMAGMPLTGDKRQQRLQRNRASAQLSRERKKQYMKLLEKQLREMADLNEGLAVQINALTSENATLKSRLAKLAMRERVANRFPRAGPNVTSTTGSSGESQASMPGLSHSPVASHACSSDADSAFSAPATPHVDEEEGHFDLPPAKKLKVASFSTPASGGPAGSQRNTGGFNARTGMLLFTIVMSVGLMYSLVGLDPTLGGGELGRRSVTPAVLEPIEEVAAVHQIVTMPHRGRVLASVTDADEDAFALVPVDARTASGAAEPNAPTVTPAVDSANAIDVYTDPTVHLKQSAPATSVLRDLFRNGHLTIDAGGNYIFAPSAVRITRSIWDGMMNDTASDVEEGTPSEVHDAESDAGVVHEKQVALFDRSGRSRGLKRGRFEHKRSTQARLRQLPVFANALPTPNEGGEMADPYDMSDHGTMQIGDKLLLWVPMHTVAHTAGGGVHMQNDSSDVGADEKLQSGLVEIACQIANVRPIVLS